MTYVDNNNLQSTWRSDQGDGTFINPVLHADYSDPDVIRVGDNFYMTASSFGHIPGLPILHSKDLINWKIINYAITHMNLSDYHVPQHGNGVWAPSIRYYNNTFWIFYGDPDVGILMTTANDPAGEWSPLHLVKAGKGIIDTCPLWDDDGNAYLVHAYANSRCGIKHQLNMCKMSPDGKHLLDEGEIIFSGTIHHPTVEGPKLYKRNGYYYIFAPAGGVTEGWQLVLRSQQIYGPYEEKVVLHQGNTPVNGPHQGGWVELQSDESWFMHFQDKGAYGRIVHLQPVQWVNDWPLIGINQDEQGLGEPVLHYKKPNVGASYSVSAPETSDDFNRPQLGLQWQWQANPLEAWLDTSARESHLRLFAASFTGSTLYEVPNLLLQKFPAEAFSITVKMDLYALKAGDTAGITIFGQSYASLELRKSIHSGINVYLTKGTAEREDSIVVGELIDDIVYLKVIVEKGARCYFSFGKNVETFIKASKTPFIAQKGHWVGAKFGLFNIHRSSRNEGGYVDIDWIKVEVHQLRT